MSTSAMARPLTPSSRHPDLKALSPGHHRQCWTLPPLDRSISAGGLDFSLTLSPTNQRNSRKAQTPSFRPYYTTQTSSHPPKIDLNLNCTVEDLFMDSDIRKRPSALFSPCGLAQRLELQPPLAARLMRDSERRELEKIDVFSPKPYIRQSLKTTSTTPIRSRNNATRTTMSIAPTSPFVKCLLSNTPAKLLSKSSHQSANLSFNHPPKIKHLSMQGELDRERKKGTLQNDQIPTAVDPMTSSEKAKRPLPVELGSSPISSAHDLTTNIPSGCKPTQLGGLPDPLSSSPVRDADEDPFMTSSKRRKLSDQ